MKLAIMQPYFLPYIGYFQLMAAVDVFVLYDNIKYTKKGWINRNRFLLNGKDASFSVALKKDSDILDVRERELAATFNRTKLLNQLKGAYTGAPYFSHTFQLVERIVNWEGSNLFAYIHHALLEVRSCLRIETEIRISSDIAIDHRQKGQDKVLALCDSIGADTYINPIGGTELYSHDKFRERGIQLRFLRARPFEYPQFGMPFVPWLSIIDVLMFNPTNVVRDNVINNYELI